VSAALRELQEHLGPLLQAAGFDLVDQVLSGSSPWWLGYRRSDAAGPLLVHLTENAEAGLLVAELWQPGRLAEARCLTRPFGAATDRAAVVAEITGQVSDWLQESGVPPSGAGSAPFHLLLV
jgi:hypothetical protein